MFLHNRTGLIQQIPDTPMYNISYLIQPIFHQLQNIPEDYRYLICPDNFYGGACANYTVSICAKIFKNCRLTAFSIPKSA
jgi:hypothetical protein